MEIPYHLSCPMPSTYLPLTIFSFLPPYFYPQYLYPGLRRVMEAAVRDFEYIPLAAWRAAEGSAVVTDC